MDHLQQCFTELDSCPGIGDIAPAVEFALWYHDFVYEPGSACNEEESARAAIGVCETAGLPPSFGRLVGELILVTGHDRAPSGPAQETVADIDLSILGSDSLTFRRYEENIRREYFFVEDCDFRRARACFLKGLLVRETIYSTVHFRNKYESKARVNLTASVEALEFR
jgi:predicted metal-dependent HD superfamily phosphohydrolase